MFKEIGIDPYSIRKYVDASRAMLHFAVGSPLSFPTNIQVQTQSFCNAKCQICPYPSIYDKNPAGTMDTDLFMKIAQEAANEPLLSEFGVMLQNEPLLDKRIFSLIRQFKSLNNKKRCIIVTNGMLIDRFSIEEIIQSNIDRLSVSLNAHTKETFNLLNEGIDYERVLRNLDLLLQNTWIKARLNVSFVLTKQNKEEISAAVTYWRGKGVNVTVLDLSNRAGAVQSYENYKLTERRSDLYLRFMKMQDLGRFYRISCRHPFTNMTILFNGDVTLCCQDWERSIIVGNVKKNSLKQIWNSEQMNAIRKSVLKKEYGCVKPCKDCSLAT